MAQYGRMVALVFSFVFAVIPPLIGWWFVPETLGMRDIDFNKEKYEEKLIKLQQTMSQDEQHAYIYMSNDEKKQYVNDSWVLV